MGSSFQKELEKQNLSKFLWTISPSVLHHLALVDPIDAE
jgi:hypothetical protein